MKRILVANIDWRLHVINNNRGESFVIFIDIIELIFIDKNNSIVAMPVES